MRKVLAIIALGLALVACAADPAVRQVQTLAVTCEAYASALRSLAAYYRAGQLSGQQVATVNGIVTVVSPICRADPASLTDLSGALAAIEAQVLEIVALKNGVANGR